MIVKLKGFIEFCSEEYIDLDVNGIVFRVFISNKSIDKIYPSESLVSIFVYEIIKENERLFFGFLEYQEREIFSDLLSVQGVGGKMALNIMSKLEINEIMRFEDRRSMPIIKPKIVASIMPTIASKSVLKMPTINTSLCVLEFKSKPVRFIPSVVGMKPAISPIKSKPGLILRRSRFVDVLSNKK